MGAMVISQDDVVVEKGNCRSPFDFAQGRLSTALGMTKVR
jgi:hypothetical protein